MEKHIVNELPQQEVAWSRDHPLTQLLSLVERLVDRLAKFVQFRWDLLMKELVDITIDHLLVYGKHVFSCTR